MTYSSSLSMSRQQRFASRNQNAVDFRNRSQRLGPISNTVMLIVLACLLGLLYLTQVTKTNAYGYQVNALTEQQAQLKSEHDDLEVASARLQSLDRVRASSQATALAPTAPSGTVQN
ncbi:MAG: hypothetical protein JWP13_193 [Candidatus Saccharibacteria bacterium]|nr:hypothetical protein [Candidatus Saccharibacteria bacterium]